MTTASPPQHRAAAIAYLDAVAREYHPNRTSTDVFTIRDGSLPATNGAGGRFPKPLVGRHLDDLDVVLIGCAVVLPHFHDVEVFTPLGLARWRSVADPYGLVVPRLGALLSAAIPRRSAG